MMLLDGCICYIQPDSPKQRSEHGNILWPYFLVCVTALPISQIILRRQFWQGGFPFTFFKYERNLSLPKLWHQTVI